MIDSLWNSAKYHFKVISVSLVMNVFCSTLAKFIDRKLKYKDQCLVCEVLLSFLDIIVNSLWNSAKCHLKLFLSVWLWIFISFHHFLNLVIGSWSIKVILILHSVGFSKILSDDDEGDLPMRLFYATIFSS